MTSSKISSSGIIGHCHKKTDYVIYVQQFRVRFVRFSISGYMVYESCIQEFKKWANWAVWLGKKY